MYCALGRLWLLGRKFFLYSIVFFIIEKLVCAVTICYRVWFLIVVVVLFWLCMMDFFITWQLGVFWFWGLFGIVLSIIAGDKRDIHFVWMLLDDCRSFSVSIRAKG